MAEIPPETSGFSPNGDRALRLWTRIRKGDPASVALWVAGLALLALVAVASWHERKDALAEAATGAQEYARAGARHARQDFFFADLILDQVAVHIRQNSHMDRGQNSFEAFLRTRFDFFRDVRQITIYDNAGRVLAHAAVNGADAVAPQFPARPPLLDLNDPNSEGLLIWPMERNTRDTVTVVPIGHRVDLGRRGVGYILLRLDFGFLDDPLPSIAPGLGRGEIVDRAGSVIEAADKNGLGASIDDVLKPDILKDLFSRGSGTYRIEPRPGNGSAGRQFVFAAIPDFPLILIAPRNPDIAEARWNRAVLPYSILGVLLVIVLIGATWAVSRQARKRQAVQRALAAKETELRKLAVIAAEMDHLCILYDLDGRIEWVNESFQRTTGYSFAEVAGKMVRNVLHGPDTDDEVAAKIREAVRHFRPFRAELLNYRKDGSTFWIDIRGQPIMDGGRPVALVAIGTDVTERKRFAADLEFAKEEAIRSSAAKSDFLTSMSHELRTPLNAILGFSELIERQCFGPVGVRKYLEYARDIRQSGEHLLELINDILDLSKVEQRKFALAEFDFNLAELVTECVRALRVLAHGNGAMLFCIGKFPTIHADERAIRQIIFNLISNAIKYSPRGGLIEIFGSVSDNGEISVAVTDQGIGISADQMARIFEPFGQVRSWETRKVPGTGIGLPLSRGLAELHGGRLEVSSEPGRGTTALLILPALRLVRPAGEETPERAVEIA